MDRFAEYVNPYIEDDAFFKQLSDGKLLTEDGCEFDIHQFHLATSNKYFYAVFCNTGGKRENVLVPGISGDILNLLLNYCYNRTVRFSDENVHGLLVAADYMIMDDFLSQLTQDLKYKLTVQNCIPIFTAALQIFCDDLLEISYRYIQTHFDDIVFNVKFGEIPLHAFQQFLGDKNLRVNSERSVYSAIYRWIEADKSNREVFMPQLMQKLMISDIDENLYREILEMEAITNVKIWPDIPLPFTELELIRNSRDPRYDRRLPKQLHCIIRRNCKKGIPVREIYLTYDECIDLWRKITETDSNPLFILSINKCLIMIDTCYERNLGFNIVENSWFELSEFVIPRYNYAVVELNSCIYAIGGMSVETQSELYSVESYDFEEDQWSLSSSIIPVSRSTPVALNDSIYLIGYIETTEDKDLVAQVYNASNNTWMRITSPPLKRTHFAFVCYHEKLYVIGGKNDDGYLTQVEEYSPEKNDWKAHSSLPYKYYFIKAAVINDFLVVYDCHLKDQTYMRTKPPVFWNVEKACWEKLEKSSPLNNLHLYDFLRIERDDSSLDVFHINRLQETHFEKSPFA